MPKDTRKLASPNEKSSIEYFQNILGVSNRYNTYDKLLDCAVLHRHAEIAQQLINCGANQHQLEKGGRSLLFTACYVGEMDTIEMLLNNGVDVNIKSRDGIVALIQTVRLNGHNPSKDYGRIANIAKLLASQGAIVPSDIAEYDGHNENTDIAIEEGKEIFARNKQNEMSLTKSAQKEFLDANLSGVMNNDLIKIVSEYSGIDDPIIRAIGEKLKQNPQLEVTCKFRYECERAFMKTKEAELTPQTPIESSDQTLSPPNQSSSPSSSFQPLGSPIKVKSPESEYQL